MNKYDGFKVGRFKYEGKVTRKRIEGFIEGIVNKKIPQYYECNLNYQSKHSIHLIGIFNILREKSFIFIRQKFQKRCA